MVRIWLGGMMANEWTKQHTLTAALVRCSHQLPFFQVRTRPEAHKLSKVEASRRLHQHQR
jgi:hypothetical protein